MADLGEVTVKVRVLEELGFREMERLVLKESDILVFTTPRAMSDFAIERVCHLIMKLVPKDTKVFVLEGGARLSVLSPE